MAKTINIYDPKEKVFGKLSNLYRQILTIDDDDWFSPQNYIYANLLKNSTYKTQIKIIKNPFKIYDTYKELYNKSIADTLWNAYFTAYSKLLENNPDLSLALLQTENKTITYRSQNTIIGVNNKGEGQNIIGKVLNSLRYRIKNILSKKSEEDYTYNIYIVYTFLRDQLYNGHDIDQFQDIDFESFITETIPDEYKIDQQTFNIKNIDINSSISIQTIAMADNSTVNNIISYIKKIDLRKYRNIIYMKKRLIVLNMYINYLIKKNFKHLNDSDKQTARFQTIESISLNEKDIADTIYDSYKNNLLSTKLSNKIDSILEERNIADTPDIEDVEEAEKFVIVKQKGSLFDRDIKLPDSRNIELERIKNRLDSLLTQIEPITSEEPIYKTINNINTLQEIMNTEGGLHGYIDNIRSRIDTINELLDSKDDTPESKQELKNELNILESPGFHLLNPSEIDERSKNLEKEIKKQLTQIKEDISRNLEHYARLTRNELVQIIKQDISQAEADHLYETELKRYKKDVRKEIKKAQKKLLPTEDLERTPHKRPTIIKQSITLKSEDVGIEGDIVLIYISADNNIKQNIIKGFSPDIYFTKDIDINGLQYKSITHYVITLLYYNMVLSINTMNDAYNKILTPEHTFKNIDQISQEYTIMYLQDKDDYTKRNCIIAINKKFENEELQTLLLSTKSSRIIYDDKKDDILGVGQYNNGQNFVGKYLEYKRNPVVL